MSEHLRLPVDAEIRRAALDPRRSFIVQAPAGSGKTELLIQRVLTLLAGCERPEEVLAITFTRKAAGEMKARLLDALIAAQGAPPETAHARHTWDLACRALARDRTFGWGLLDNPTRLQVMTIDSFCSTVVRRIPWLSRFGCQPQVTDDPERLYRQACAGLITRLETDPTADGAAFETLLGHLDNRVTRLRDLLVTMLARRDQWVRYVLPGEETPRHALERNLQGHVAAAVNRFCQLLGPALLTELEALAGYAAMNLPVDEPLTQILAAGPDRNDASRFWVAARELALTRDGKVRKTVNKNNGFPAGKESAAVTMKERMGAFLEAVADDPRLFEAFGLLDDLPQPSYSDQQWQILQALLQLLPLALAELSLTFVASGEVDFVEIAGAARRGLGEIDRPEDLLLQFDSRLRHILVDEFQDTSYGQYQLLSLLTAGWGGEDDRSLFVVGDPMQSIYRFREAEVGLYLHARSHGLPNVPLDALTLRANFRSQAGIVDWVNAVCPRLFPAVEDPARGAVPYAPACAVREGARDAVEIICYTGRQDEAEATDIVSTVKALQEDRRIATTAILVRSRNQLPAIIAALKQAGIRFYAQEIDPLLSRAVTRDLVSLTRALLHPADRIAWLALLRAPFCGLMADDLLHLCADAGKRTLLQQLHERLADPGLFGLSSDATERLQRILPVLDLARQKRGTLPLRRLIESTWLTLGGPACVSDAELNDAETFFTLLQDLDSGGDLVDFDQLDRRLAQLYASPDPAAGDALQIMTIHKAKGLEFDAVILPGLGRGARGEDPALLRWIDHPQHGVLLAPIPATDQSDAGETYRALGRLMKERADLEALRLFYVAVTRAREKLVLFGHVNGAEVADAVPPAGSLLRTVWPGLDPALIQLREAPASEPVTAEPPRLSRLPIAWRLPDFPCATAPGSLTVLKPSDKESPLPAATRYSATASRSRIVGTVVHAWLQKISEEDATWDVDRVQASGALIRQTLIGHGVAEDEVQDAARRVIAALQTTLRSKTGHWLLQTRPDAANELALHGQYDGRVVHAVVDRTFVADAVRWIVDYKTSTPSPGTALPDFLDSEATRYQPQLQLYVALLSGLYPDQELRCGLYFPLIDGWIEVSAAAVST